MDTFLKDDIRLKGEALVDGKAIGQIVFSDGTYQVEVKEGEEVFWPFLQFDEKGKVKDFFCSCPQSENQTQCLHVAAAFLAIHDAKGKPIHVRFMESFWKAITFAQAKRFGFEERMLKKEKETYFFTDGEGEKVFGIRAKKPEVAKKLKELLEQRPIETEETSIKFSNLSEEEIERWKKGNPSLALRYELSFWSELAKWLFLRPISLHFKEVSGFFPESAIGTSEDLEIFFKIYKEDLPEIIPALGSVESNLTLFEEAGENIQEITYDPVKKSLFVVLGKEKSGEKVVSEEMLKMGDWEYLPGKGFYKSVSDPLIAQGEIPEKKVSDFLTKHRQIVKENLKNAEIETDLVKAQYALHFDEEQRLHIDCFVFQPGDLQKRGSAVFNHWVFLEGRGFIHLSDLIFDSPEKRILSKEKIGPFVTQNRLWLNKYEGFQTHLAIVESQLKHFFDAKGNLCFSSYLDLTSDKGELLDLGEWVYVKDKGFYPKASGKVHAKILSGTKIPSAEIAEFIKEHREELEPIKGFFNDFCPIEKAGISLSVASDETIIVEPEILFLPSYLQKQPKIFDEFVYVEGEGFSELPPEWKIPPVYLQRKEIPPQERDAFVLTQLDQLRKFAIYIDPKLSPPKSLQLHVENLFPDEETNRFLTTLSYHSELGSISLSELSEKMQKKERIALTSAGLIHLEDYRFQWLKRLGGKENLKEDKALSLSLLDWIRINTYDPPLPPKGSSETDRQTRIFLEEIKQCKTNKILDLKGLKSELRPYQKTGVDWLWFMYCHGLSVLLCDDMGLGKTHQAMALITAVTNAERGRKVLVVCPTSVVYHWEELLKNFLPKLKVLIFHGASRSLKYFERRYDLLLTTYGIMRSEQEALTEIGFEIAVFDELQIAKNRKSQTHKALRGIHAKMRLGLSGTPIENRLQELKAIFDVILPNYLPPEALYQEIFVVPIEKYHDQAKKILLSQMIRPFLLRRKKSEVLKELPEKIEEIAYCDLSDQQKELYKNAYLEAKETISGQLKDASQPVPYTHIFALFSKLKQICDHPALYYKDPQNFHRYESGKWDLFVELMDEIRASKQKVVIFSQYLDMLDIIEAYLNKENVGFAGIRGATINRKEQLERFRADPKCEVFVASLQAAGVGIDLVTASIVIHYDRWWNPAKENQATDRVHRIGQKRGVQVFKCVTKNTIEEHIHFLIEKKKGLIEEIVGYDSADELKGMSREDLLALLQKVELDERVIEEEEPLD